MIDPKAIKPGDEVTVRLKVRDALADADGARSFLIASPDQYQLHHYLWIGPEFILDHTPAPREWKKGDLVRTASGSPAVIQGISDDWAWVRLVDGSQPFTLNLSDLTPIPQGGEQ